MPASERKYEMGIYINRLLLCLRNILIAVICLLIASWSFGWVTQKHGYFRYYINSKGAFVAGEYTGYRLQQLESLAPERTCLILGASSAREGFDLEKLEEKLPDLDFISFATTGHNTIPIQARLLPKNRFACIIVATHPFFVYTATRQSKELKQKKYASQMPFFELIRMLSLDGDISTKELKLLSGTALVPNMRHSQILKKHLKRAFRDLKSLFAGGLSDFRASRFLNITEGMPASHILHKDERAIKMQSFVQRRAEIIKQKDWENPLRYRSSSSNGTLEMTLKRLDSLTERLIVIDLPETPVYEKVIKASFTSFAKTLHNAVPDLEFYQCEFTFLDAYGGFVDTIHVNSEGRQHLTKELIDILNGKSKNILCSAPNIN